MLQVLYKYHTSQEKIIYIYYKGNHYFIKRYYNFAKIVLYKYYIGDNGSTSYVHLNNFDDTLINQKFKDYDTLPTYYKINKSIDKFMSDSDVEIYILNNYLADIREDNLNIILRDE